MAPKHQSPPSELRSKLDLRKHLACTVRKLACAIGLDAAITFSVGARLWQLVAATFTVVLMTQFFTGERQGLYYTIVSLLAIQNFLDLGLSGILVLLASHEWAHVLLLDGKVSGAAEAKGRLAEIYRFGCWWYSRCAAVFLLLTTPIGIMVLFHGKQEVSALFAQEWLLPWIICVTLNAISMLLVPRIAVLEGCNQVVPVNRMRFLQSVSGSIFIWISIASGFGLWTLVVSNLVRLVWELKIVYGEYAVMLSELNATPNRNQLNWRKEIWPLQWRLAIQSICSYFATWFIVPVTFRFHGEIAAGQIGLTWQLLTTVQAASLAWLQTRLPRFGALLASQKHRQFELEILRASLLSVAVFLGGMMSFFLAVFLAKLAGVDLAGRFIPNSAILFFACGMVGWTLAMAEQSYVRLFKTDPFLLISVFASCLVASAIWHFGSTSGSHGLSIAYFIISWFYAVPVSTWILVKHRRKVVLPRLDSTSGRHQVQIKPLP
jgi:hypothetical protein